MNAFKPRGQHRFLHNNDMVWASFPGRSLFGGKKSVLHEKAFCPSLSRNDSKTRSRWIFSPKHNDPHFVGRIQGRDVVASNGFPQGVPLSPGSNNFPASFFRATISTVGDFRRSRCIRESWMALLSDSRVIGCSLGITDASSTRTRGFFPVIRARHGSGRGVKVRRTQRRFRGLGGRHRGNHNNGVFLPCKEEHDRKNSQCERVENRIASHGIQDSRFPLRRPVQ